MNCQPFPEFARASNTRLLVNSNSLKSGHQGQNIILQRQDVDARPLHANMLALPTLAYSLSKLIEDENLTVSFLNATELWRQEHLPCDAGRLRPRSRPRNKTNAAFFGAQRDRGVRE